MTLDVLVLEDNGDDIFLMTHYLRGRNYELVEDSSSFRSAIESGTRAKVYFLDDYVPEDGTRSAEPMFLVNYAFLMDTLTPEEQRDSIVLYSGSTAKPDVEDFCRLNGIAMVKKTYVRDLAEQLKEPEQPIPLPAVPAFAY
ncbi:hypothetical protein HN419_04015 [Candidatus Woesearchaeota archaeon]|jgi:hypothetical protein|nr:hypothetical protein [Candidatus Woesearchaeota archaeon]MBT3537956.1 hypothetical protein [Candidatus Woesearchaeota archaeon]MBT4697311.1 hypothetical protein [Candidatus Woesearchaeota archaeon]MBT4717031.1 hypothetical protein [Candidatus Woesearchaeota archaeon]MBT7105625.1 hypothetical protein [Candidatus Woesearchaeota archaeon]